MYAVPHGDRRWQGVYPVRTKGMRLDGRAGRDASVAEGRIESGRTAKTLSLKLVIVVLGVYVAVSVPNCEPSRLSQHSLRASVVNPNPHLPKSRACRGRLNGPPTARSRLNSNLRTVIEAEKRGRASIVEDSPH
jgi:hypothetical protein